MESERTFEAIIFDCDGTLADTMPPHYESWIATLRRHGLDLSEDRFYALGGWPTVRILELLAGERGLALDCNSVAAEKETAFEQLLSEVQAIEPVRAVAEKWRGKVPMAVATGGVRRIAESILAHLGILDWFDAVVTAEDVPHHKPAPDIFLEAARRLGVAPTDCLVYEDSDPGIEAAQRAGMQYADVREFFQPRRVTKSA
ncbi:MAG: HAD-IA family hydrolase [Planctomycetota bacterium]|nr:HAD-IA family hydrolase [Planctomycetota bacterium]